MLGGFAPVMQLCIPCLEPKHLIARDSRSILHSFTSAVVNIHVTFQSRVVTIYTTCFDIKITRFSRRAYLFIFYDVYNYRSYYFRKQHYPPGLCNGDALCCLYDLTEFINIILDEFRLQNVQMQLLAVDVRILHFSA